MPHLCLKRRSPYWPHWTDVPADLAPGPADSSREYGTLCPECRSLRSLLQHPCVLLGPVAGEDTGLRALLVVGLSLVSAATRAIALLEFHNAWHVPDTWPAALHPTNPCR